MCVFIGTCTQIPISIGDGRPCSRGTQILTHLHTLNPLACTDLILFKVILNQYTGRNINSQALIAVYVLIANKHHVSLPTCRTTAESRPCKLLELVSEPFVSYTIKYVQIKSVVLELQLS